MANVLRPLLTDRQVRLFLNDVHEFGFTDCTFEEIRRIADEVHARTHNEGDPVALFMCRQIDEAIEARRTGVRPDA